MQDARHALLPDPQAPYEAVVADTDLSKRIHYRLRYQVYCLETGFEDPAAFGDSEESDAYDAHAIHFLVRCTTTGEWLAAARLVVREQGPLPVETHCRIDASLLASIGSLDGEVSRLLIVRRQSDGRAVRGLAGEDLLCSRTEILRRLLIGLCTRAQELGLYNLAFFLSPALRRILGRLGVDCAMIGDPCHHRGTRYPYAGNVPETLEALYEHGPAMPGVAEVSRPYYLFSEMTLPLASTIPLASPGERSSGVSPACRGSS